MAPSKVIIIRHGEKTDDESDPNLSPAGEQRALNLVNYFDNTSPHFGDIVAIYAAAPKHKGSSTRAGDTVRHVAANLHIDVNLEYERESKDLIGHRDSHGKPEKSSQTKMAKEILAESKYEGKSVLICWEHKTIPDLIVSLQGPEYEWKHGFANVVVLNYSHHGHFESIDAYTQPF